VKAWNFTARFRVWQSQTAHKTQPLQVVFRKLDLHVSSAHCQRPHRYCTRITQKILTRRFEKLSGILGTTHRTVKASNFGPCGKFGPFLCKFCSFLGWIMYQKLTEPNLKSKCFPQLLSSSFFCRTRFNYNKPFWKRSPKFPWGPKLGALTVHSSTSYVYPVWETVRSPPVITSFSFEA
jgi:hypothetical protein